MTSFGLSDPAEIAEVDRFELDPEFPQHDGMQRWRLTFAPTQHFGEPHEGEVERERGSMRRGDPQLMGLVCSLLHQGVLFK
jgi:hypothetical protein